MVKTFKRAVAAFAVIIICITDIGTMSANAASVTVNSGLSYEIYVEKTGSKEVTVHVDFSNNLVLTTFTFFLYYDKNCSITDDDVAYPDGDTAVVDATSRYVVVTGAYTNRKKDFSYDFTFKTSNSANNAHTFSGVVASYTTKSDVYASKSNEDITVKTGDLYTVGDVDDDGMILAIDAYYIACIAEKYGSPTVTYVNNNISAIRKNINANIVCGEVADADGDDKITDDDRAAVLTYYATTMVDAKYIDPRIGYSYYMTITA